MWGTTGTAASFLPADVPPVATGASTMAIGGILLFLWSSRRSLTAIGDRRSRGWLLLGAVGVVVYPLAFYTSMHEAGVAIGNVVSLGSGPVFAAVFEWLWERHRLGRRWAVATTTALVGMGILVTSRHAGEGEHGNVPLGVALGLLAGLAYALYTYASSRAIATGHPSNGVMGGMFGLGAVVLVPILVLTGAPLLQSPSSVGIAAYLAIGPMFLAYLLFGVGLRTIRSSSATTITLIEPLVATALAVIVVGERLSVLGWLGLLLILGGIVILVTARPTSRNPEPS